MTSRIRSSVCAAGLAAFVWVTLAYSAEANPVSVTVTADPSLDEATVSVRAENSGAWSFQGDLHGSPAIGVLILEDDRPYQVRVEKREFWTVRTSVADYRPSSEAQMGAPMVLRMAEPVEDINLSTLLKLLVPLILIGGGALAWVLMGLNQRQRALRKRIDKKERNALRAVRKAMSRPRSRVPDELAMGAYEIGDRLGSGGMATVYSVRDKSGLQYALKIPHAGALNSPHQMERFEREMDICVRLVHPNIIRTFDAGTCKAADGHVIPYMVMERVQGTDLGDLIRINTQAQRAPDVSLALLVVRGLLQALDAAHQLGVIHRDIKPSNVIVTDDRQVKLMDFGIARVTDSKTIMQGATIGTPDYMSPEQLSAPDKVDARSDLFSVGVLIYELSTYKLPHPKTDGLDFHELLRSKTVAVVSRPRSINPAVPLAFDMFIMRLLEPRAKDRFASARVALAALQWAEANPEEKLSRSMFSD